MKPIYKKHELTEFLSVAKHLGELHYAGRHYLLVNADGVPYKNMQTIKDDKMLQLENVADLVDVKYLPYYKHFGREIFCKLAKRGMNAFDMWAESERMDF